MLKRKILLLLTAVLGVAALGFTAGCGDKQTDDEKKTVENAGQAANSTPAPANATSGGKKGSLPIPPP